MAFEVINPSVLAVNTVLFVSAYSNGVATFIAKPSVGSGNIVLDTAPTIVNPTIAKLANLTGNGFVKTSGSDGTLSIDTSTYLTSSFAGSSSIVTTGTVTSGTWSGSFGAVSGANLTNITAANITGSHTLSDGVLSTNVPLLNAQNTFAAGTITTSQPHAITQTWNSSGVAFVGLLVNVTNSASSASALLMDLQVGSATQFRVSKGGSVDYNGNISAANNTLRVSQVALNLSGTAGAKITATASGNATTSIDLGLERNAAGVWEVNSGTTGAYRDIKVRSVIHDATNTAVGTTGNQTINKSAGTVNIAASGTSITVTNSLVTASSLVFAVVRTNDTTAVIKNVVPGAGSFVITMNAAVTAETSIGFLVVN